MLSGERITRWRALAVLKVENMSETEKSFWSVQGWRDLFSAFLKVFDNLSVQFSVFLCNKVWCCVYPYMFRDCLYKFRQLMELAWVLYFSLLLACTHTALSEQGTKFEVHKKTHVCTFVHIINPFSLLNSENFIPWYEVYSERTLCFYGS